MKHKYPHSPVHEPLLTTSEVCERYRVIPQWIYRHHGLPKVYIGGQLRFKGSELDAFFAKKGLL